MSAKIKITVNGVMHEAEAGRNILQILLDLGIMLPHFCYHEALGAAGACRLCAAMISPGAGKPARLEMACMTRAEDGMIVDITNPQAVDFREKLIEELMLNHPHDCPVCDEGGECMLQDMTVLCRHQHRRNRFPKRTWRNQDLGPHIHHEMNRCITCYRCVRFYRDYALGDDLGVFGSRGRVYFGRMRDGALVSEFSGNLVDVCPTGVFTDKHFRAVYCRPWDLQTAPSICPHCSVGCNVLPGSRHKTLRRIKPRRNHTVNRFFMCDHGRFGGGFVNADNRLTSARFDGAGMSLDDAITQTAERLKEIVQTHGRGAVAAIGSPGASLEANAALILLMKTLEGRFAFFSTGAERAAHKRAAVLIANGQVNTPSLPEVEQADFTLIVGGDITREAPMMDLAVRQTIRAGAPLFIISPQAGKLDAFAKAARHAALPEQAAIVSNIAQALDHALMTGQPDPFAGAAASALATAKRPQILCGATGAGGIVLVDAAHSLAAKAVRPERPCRLVYWFPAMNSFGISLARNDESPDTIKQDVENGRIKALTILEHGASLDSEWPDDSKPMKSCFTIAVDAIAGKAATDADAVLPCASHYETFGTVMNYEGRAQRFEGLPLPRPVTWSSAEVLLKLIEALGAGEAINRTEYHDLFEIPATMSSLIGTLAPDSEGLLIRSTAAVREVVG